MIKLNFQINLYCTVLINGDLNENVYSNVSNNQMIPILDSNFFTKHNPDGTYLLNRNE